MLWTRGIRMTTLLHNLFGLSGEEFSGVEGWSLRLTGVPPLPVSGVEETLAVAEQSWVEVQGAATKDLLKS